MATTLDERTARLYRNRRRDGEPARVAWYVAKNASAWHRELSWTGDGSWFEMEHDGHTFRVKLEQDDDAWNYWREDVENGWMSADEQPTYAYWCVVIVHVSGDVETTVDALCGIAGGHVDDRGYANEDDELYAYVWSDVVWPAVQDYATCDRESWRRRLEMVGSE